MSQNNNYTIWQRLNKVFGPDSTLDQQAPIYVNNGVFEAGRNQVL